MSNLWDDDIGATLFVKKLALNRTSALRKLVLQLMEQSNYRTTLRWMDLPIVIIKTVGRIIHLGEIHVIATTEKLE